MHEDKQPDAKEAKQLWSKIWEQNKKADWVNNMKKELHGLEEGSETDILLELLRATHKKYHSGKLQDMMATWIHVHPRKIDT